VPERIVQFTSKVGAGADLSFSDRLRPIQLVATLLLRRRDPMPTDRQATALPWAKYRAYLGLLARLRLPTYLCRKLDASDIVQDTLKEAFQVSAQLEAMTEGARLAFLRRALDHNLADVVRWFDTQMRKVGRECSLVAALAASATRTTAWLKAGEPPPGNRMEQEEQLLSLAAALTELPEDQRTAVEMKHLQGCSVADVSRAMGRSPTAVGGLLCRGVRRLREILQPFG
jgi:RNA polymerase sigma-70 factor (ECF subfamily)